MPVGDLDLGQRDELHPAGGRGAPSESGSAAGRAAGARDAALAALAYDQYGVVARAQLLAAGFSVAEVEVLLARRRLHPVHRGVYAVGHRRLTEKARWMAAVLAGGDGAVLSHRSAARLLRILDQQPARIEITTPHSSGSGRARSGLRVHRTRRLDAEDFEQRWGIPVTSPSRTLVDLASVLRPRALRDGVHATERLHLLDLAKLSRLCDRSGGRRGIGQLRRILASYRPLPETRSWLQDRYLRLCDEAGLPRPAADVVVEGYEVDCFWPEHGVVVELDSWGFHRNPDSFEVDRKRDIDLRLAGLTTLRFTHRRVVGEPRSVIAETRAALQRVRLLRNPTLPAAG